LGLAAGAEGLVGWDVFQAVLTPGAALWLSTWRDGAAAEAFEARAPLPADVRLRRVRIVRDDGMHDRREAPQDHPDAPDTDSAV
jgi:hypothetical protein